MTEEDYDNLLTEQEEKLSVLEKELSELAKSLTEISDEMLETDINANNAQGFIRRIAKKESYNSQLRDRVIEVHGVLHNLIKKRMLHAGQVQDATMLLEDCEQLGDHNEYYSDRIAFLMSNVMDFVNIKQNRIIQVFSVASVALLPPTLVASVYGMNITIPELVFLGSGGYAYMWAVFLMICSAAIPMYLFWRKGWLK